MRRNPDQRAENKAENNQPEEQEESIVEEMELSQDQVESLCREQVCPECPELTKKEDELLRVLADTENFKKRLTKEKEDFCRYANEGILEDFLPVIDNLELAVTHSTDVDACKELREGVELTLKIFMDTLKKHGVEVVGEEGEPFDPAKHEALAQEERADMEEGMVCQLFQRGYMLNNRLVRPAKVMVSKKCD